MPETDRRARTSSVDVVIVDDVPEVRALLRNSLRFRPRFTTAGEAGTAAEAVALVERIRPQIVILDLGLPDLSGHRLVGRIREASPDSKIVIFTGAQADDPSWFAERSAAYVHKDDFDLLVDTLESLTTPPPSVTAEFSLPAAAVSVALAREHVRRQARAWCVPQLVDDAVVIASELASNAVEHGHTGFELRLELRDQRVLRIEVTDHGAGNPEPRLAAATSERGRGLFIVSALAASWGVQAVEGAGKVVWAELSGS